MRDILLRVPDAIKVKLDRKRKEGYCQNTLINVILAKALADPPIARRRRKGRRAA